MLFKNRIFNKNLYYTLSGAIFGAVYAMIEYYSKLKTANPELLFPLLLRAMVGGAMFFIAISYVGKKFNKKLKQKKFIIVLFIKSLVFTLIISVILIFINLVWFLLNPQMSFWFQARTYFTYNMYFINIATIFPGMLIIIAISQFASLHRKGDLLNFILGRYNIPMEVERVFCFADLKGSTSIAEILGNLKYAAFLKEYYSDISEVVSDADAQIYQYVGDEVVLSWPFKKALKNNNMINCIFQMKEMLQNNKQKYINDFGFMPYFRAGLHGGKVVVSWVGGSRKEIVYIGDVVNTTARIQGDCKRLNMDFLISGNLLEQIEDLGQFKASFIEETILRGKVTKVKLYGLEKID